MLSEKMQQVQMKESVIRTSSNNAAGGKICLSILDVFLVLTVFNIPCL